MIFTGRLLSPTQRRPSQWLSLVLVTLAAAIPGCQTAERSSPRPLLPLIEPLREENSPVQIGFGTPILATVRGTPTEITNIESSPVRLASGKAIGEPQALPACFTREATLDLDDAFRQASIENPRIGLAEEIVRANEAERTLARSLLFPTLNAGTTVTIHRGALLASNGRLREVDRESLYLGAGSDVRGAGAVNVPGVQIVSHLGDAVFAPRVAQQRVERSRHDAVGVQNNVLLEVARAYLALASAEARLLALQVSEKELAELARLTSDFAAKGAGREADALRTQCELALLRTTLLRVDEEAIISATVLARLLSADATVRLRAELGAMPLVQLVDDNVGLDSLLASAVANRPEVAARTTEVALQETRLRQERVRPFLPTIAFGLSSGNFGGGSDLAGYRMGHFASRTDLDVVAVWNVQNLGLGNRAIQNGVRAQVDIAETQRVRMIDLVHREVTEAFARSRTSRSQVDIAKRRVEAAERAFRQDILRTRDQLGRLVETLASFNLLVTARVDLVHAMAEYSQAQFDLYVALGGTPTSIHTDRGEPLPANPPK